MKFTNADRSISNIMARGHRLRSNGRWPAWKRHSITPPVTRGWLSDARKAAENGIFSVLIRDLDAPPFGIITHAAIATLGGVTDITWAERQRIKNELFGRERTAVEVMPPESELVDEAPMCHLWVMPVGYLLPFTLADRKRAEG